MILVTDDGGTSWLVSEYGRKFELTQAVSVTAWATQLTHVETVDAADMAGFINLGDDVITP